MRLRTVLAAVGLAAVVGCGAREAFEGEETVPIDRVPAPVLEAAKKALPGIKITKAWKAKVNGQDAYEVQGKTKDGKIREAEVSVTGTLLNVE